MYVNFLFNCRRLFPREISVNNDDSLKYWPRGISMLTNAVKSCVTSITLNVAEMGSRYM